MKKPAQADESIATKSTNLRQQKGFWKALFGVQTPEKETQDEPALGET